MATQKGGYWLDGERLPSVTTILSRFKESGPLLYWAWNEGINGRDFRETRDKAGDAGTAVHEMVQAWKQKSQFDRTKFAESTIDRAKKAFAAFLEWQSQTKLEIVANEVSLISKKYRYGGTLDAMLVQEKLSLGDWKTAKSVYAENLLQLAAYGILWEENYPERPILGGYLLCRFSKPEDDDAPISFSHHFWSNLALAGKQFLLLREAYDLDKKVKDLL